MVWLAQISGLTMGQRLKVSDRQKSFYHDKPGILNADELVWKGLTTWDIQSVSYLPNTTKKRDVERDLGCSAASVKCELYFKFYFILQHQK